MYHPMLTPWTEWNRLKFSNSQAIVRFKSLHVPADEVQHIIGAMKTSCCRNLRKGQVHHTVQCLNAIRAQQEMRHGSDAERNHIPQPRLPQEIFLRTIDRTALGSG